MGLADFLLGLQAVRLQVEAKRDLGGALGLRMRRHEHQVRTVSRILAASRVRHLLADEVGLGKTVEALMVVAALQRDEEGGCFLVVVPDHLARQWAEEMLARIHQGAHLARWVFEGREALRKELGLTEAALVTAELIMTLPAGRLIELAGQGLLDEVAGALQEAERRRTSTPRPTVLKALEERKPSSPPRSVLLTPRLLTELGLKLTTTADESGLTVHGLGTNGWSCALVIDEFHSLSADLRAQLLRAARWMPHLLLLTATPPLQDVDRLRDLVAMLRPELTEATSTEGLEQLLASIIRGEEAALHTLSGSMVRARRADVLAGLPKRQLETIVVEPTAGDQDRVVGARGAAVALARGPGQREAGRVLQRALRGRASLRAWGGADNLAVEVRRRLKDGLANESNARLDALLDFLLVTWEAEPAAAIVLAVGDNPTMQEVATALGERLGLDETCILVIPQQVDTLTASEAARRFQGLSGARVLIVAGEGRADASPYVGLNLQCAGHLVLYSVPWRHDVVEQLIGRLDRLGSVAGGDAVVVTALVLRGAADESVLSLLAAAGLFEEPLALDGAWLDALAPEIEDAALRADRQAWPALIEKVARRRAGLDRLQALIGRAADATKVPPSPPHDPLAPVLPAVPHPRVVAPQGATPGEEARLRWLQWLARHHHYDLRQDVHTWGPGVYGLQDARNASPLLRLREQGTAHFTMCSAQLDAPPAYALDHNGHRPLGWLAVGDSTVERLMAIWRREVMDPHRVGLLDSTGGLRVERCGALPEGLGTACLITVVELDPVGLLPPLPGAQTAFAASLVDDRRRSLGRLLRATLRPHLVVCAHVLDEGLTPVSATDLDEFMAAILAGHHHTVDRTTHHAAEAAMMRQRALEVTERSAEVWFRSRDWDSLRALLEQREVETIRTFEELRAGRRRLCKAYQRRVGDLDRGGVMYLQNVARIGQETQRLIDPLEAQVSALEQELEWLRQLAHPRPSMAAVAGAWAIVLVAA